MRDFISGLRTALTFAVAIPFTAICAVIVILVTFLRPTAPVLDNLARMWARTWCWTSGVKLVVEGSENITPKTAYVVVSNHLSAFDIFAHFAALPFPIRFLAKGELFRIPLFGSAMHRIGMVKVDRGASRAAHQAINEGTRRTMDRGWSVMIYPEGTRPRDGVLLPFKKGAFSIARKLGAPILPTAIIGSREVWKPKTKLIRPGVITVRIMEPIATDGLRIHELEDLRNRVYDQVKMALGHEPLVGRAVD